MHGPLRIFVPGQTLMVNERTPDVRTAAILATRRGQRTTWHTLRRERYAVGAGERLKRHDARTLDSARSLEALVRQFGDAEIIHDPTGAFERARRIIAAARMARRALGSRLQSLHLLANGRTLHARTRAEGDIDHVGPVVAGALARALSGAEFQIVVNVSVTAPPRGALPVERIDAYRDRALAAAQRMSAAVAVAGVTAYGMSPAAANAAEPTANTDQASPRSAPEGTRTLRAMFSRAGDFVELRLEDARSGLQGTAQRALRAVRGAERRRVDDPVRESATTEGLYIRPAEGDAEAAVVAAASGVPEEPLPQSPSTALAMIVTGQETVAPMVPEQHEPTLRTDYTETAAGALVRGDQSGAIAQVDAQFRTASPWALGAQGAIGVLDGDIAGGAQLSVQREATLGVTPVSVGAFASGVQSTAPSDEDFSIVRVGAGVAATIRSVQLIVRGGFASGSGDLDSDGGFARAEGTWFATPDLAIGGFAETDPVTGAGAGAKVSFRPFTGTLANLSVDADAAWHEDGEESFRLGLRWLLGQGEQSSLQDMARRRGITPDLMDDLRRLPDELDRAGQNKSQTQPYCGEAGVSCPTAG